MTENGALGEKHIAVEVASTKNDPTGMWDQGLSHAKRLWYHDAMGPPEFTTALPRMINEARVPCKTIYRLDAH